MWGAPGTVVRPLGTILSLGPCHTQEALEMLAPSGASVSVPPWWCSSVAILGRREQLFSEHLLCAIPYLTVPTVTQ